MISDKKIKRHRYIGITLVILNCVTFFIAIAIMTMGVPVPGTVTITSPGPNTLIESSNFSVTGTATPGKQIQIYLNNAFVGQTTSNSNGDWSINVTGVANGQINLYAKITEDPFLYIAHTGGTKTFTQIDTTTNAVVSTIPSGIKEPRSLVHHPTQPWLYVYSSQTGTIKVINSDTMETITDISGVGSNVARLITSPDGSRLYVGGSGIGGNIKIYSTSTNTLINTIPQVSYDIALTPDGSKIYAASGSTYIASYNTSDLSHLANISTSAAATRIAINNAATKAYVAESIAEQIEVVDLGLESVTNTIGVTSQPRDIAISPSGNMAVIITSGAEPQVFNLTSETITGNLSSGLGEGKLIFNADGSLAYWSNNNTKVINVATNSTIATVEKSGYGGLALNADKSKLYAGDYTNGHDIHVIDADTAPYNFIETEEYPQLEYFVELTNDGTKAYASSNSTGKIFIVNTITNSIEGSIDDEQLFNCKPAQAALNNNDTKLYVASSDCPVVFVIDTATNQFLSYFEISSVSNFIQFDSTGTKLYIASGGNILVYSTESNTVTDTISLGGGIAYTMALTSDDSKLYVSNPSNNSIVVINTTTKSVSSTIALPGMMYTITINPAGTVGYGSMAATNQYVKFSTLSDTMIGSPITTDSFPTSISFLPDGSAMYIVTNNSLIDVYNPATDIKSSTIAISSNAYIFSSGLLRNRVVNTATQNIFINTPELGEPLTVPPGYSPLATQSVTASLSSTPIAPSTSNTAVSQTGNGVSSSRSDSQNTSNLFGNIPNTIIEVIKSTPASIARVFPWILFALLMVVAGLLMLQVMLEYRNIKQTIVLADQERSLRAEKKNFLALSAHYLRTPLSIIQGGLELINFKNKKHEADGALNITKILGGEIEHVLQKLQDEQVDEPKLKMAEFDNTGLRVLASPTFLVPAVLVGIVSVSANILFINVARLDLGVINLMTQVMFFITATTVFYFVVRTFITSRAHRKAAKKLLEEETELSNTRNKLITDTHRVLSQELQHLSASIGSIEVKDQKPLLNVANGIKDFEETLAKFELAADLEAGSTYFTKNEQINISKTINHIIEDCSSILKNKDLTIKTRVPSFGNVTSNSKSLRYVISTIIDNAIKFSPKKSTISISGNRTSLGYKLTVVDHGPGINKSQLRQLFKPFSRIDNAMVFEEQGIGLSLYLDRLIMQALGGKITVDSAAGKGTKVTLLIG